MTIADKQRELLTRLGNIRNAQERFAYVVACGRNAPPLEAVFKTDAYKVEGCLAKLWFVPETRDGRCYFKTDSDSAIVKGIATLLCDFYSGQTSAEILSVDPSFLEQGGINQHLTPNRRNSLGKIWDKIREYAAEQKVGDKGSHMTK